MILWFRNIQYKTFFSSLLIFFQISRKQHASFATKQLKIISFHIVSPRKSDAEFPRFIIAWLTSIIRFCKCVGLAFFAMSGGLWSFWHKCTKLHCKYIRPDYDGTLAIHSSTIVLLTTSVVRTTMNG